jgi:peptidoglycan/xylan/chitin deacetylase (PgdA/CDA1 family)
MNGVAYLMYHELSRPDRALCNADPGYTRYVVDETTFRAHVERLRSEGFRGLSVGEALSRDTRRADGVAITFDDGCETDLVAAAPILRDAGFGATFYVTVEHVGRQGYLSKAQVRELSDLGFEIGSHAMTHRYLHDLPTPEVRRELVDSKHALEDMTGRPVLHFSCPGGRWDRRVSRTAREAGYGSLVTSVIGINSNRTDPYRLARVAVIRGMGEDEVGRIARGRGLLRRKAQATTLDFAKRVLGNARYEKLREAVLRAASRC